MPGKTPHSNGNEPVENGIRSNQDVDMKDDLKGKGKKASKDADEEMTVVVPQTRPVKSSAPPDSDGDVAMDNQAEKDSDSEAKVDPVVQTSTDIKNNFALLERAVAQFDARFSLRALRSISLIRKRLTPDIIAKVIVETFPATVASGNVAKALLFAIDRQDLPLGRPFNADTEVDNEPAKAPTKNGAKKELKEVIPEIDIFLGILIQVHLFDSKQYKRGVEFSKQLSDRIQKLNRRTLDSLSAKVYFYYNLFCEQLGPLPPSTQSPIVALRPTLLAALRTAVLRKDIDTQASVIVLLLRNYLLTSHIAQADLLVSHTQFPENAANNQVARFLYYLGRIRAIQLRYGEAHTHLQPRGRRLRARALWGSRKLPQSFCWLLSFSWAIFPTGRPSASPPSRSPSSPTSVWCRLSALEISKTLRLSLPTTPTPSPAMERTRSFSA
jgi:26S proteasome regulatory subunit N3